MGPDYAITLRAWRAAWEAKKAAVMQLGYSERFWRKFRCATAELYSARDSQRCSALVESAAVPWLAAMPCPANLACKRTHGMTMLPCLRLCRFYFAYCEAAFDARYIHNYQMLWVKDPSAARPVAAAPPFATANGSGTIISSNPVTQVHARARTQRGLCSHSCRCIVVKVHAH